MAFEHLSVFAIYSSVSKPHVCLCVVPVCCACVSGLAFQYLPFSWNSMLANPICACVLGLAALVLLPSCLDVWATGKYGKREQRKQKTETEYILTRQLLS